MLLPSRSQNCDTNETADVPMSRPFLAASPVN